MVLVYRFGFWGFGVLGLEFWVLGFRFSINGLGFGGFGFKVYYFMIWGLGLVV